MTRMDDLGEELRSNLLMISAMSNAVWVTPWQRAFRDVAFILFLLSAVRWPAYKGWQCIC